MFSKSHRIDKNLLCYTFKNVTQFQGRIQDFQMEGGMEGVRLSVADPEEAMHGERGYNPITPPPYPNALT
jgi:hypothetical protein